MSEFFSKLGNGIFILLAAGAIVIFLMTFLKSSRRNAAAGDYIQRVKAQKANTRQGNHTAIICGVLCFIGFIVASGALKWVALILALLLVGLGIIPNLMKNNSQEYQSDLHKYTKYKHQVNAQTAGAKGAAIGATAAGVAAGVAVAATGVGAPAGAAIIAGSLTAGAGAGKMVGSSTKGVHEQRANVMTDVKEDFSNTVNEEMLEAGTDKAINLAGDIITGKVGKDALENVGQHTIEAYKKQGMSEEQIAAKVQNDIGQIEQHDQPSFMNNTKTQSEVVPSFMNNKNVIDAEYHEVG